LRERERRGSEPRPRATLPRARFTHLRWIIGDVFAGRFSSTSSFTSSSSPILAGGARVRKAALARVGLPAHRNSTGKFRQASLVVSFSDGAADHDRR
jgi:hypothetical protein